MLNIFLDTAGKKDSSVSCITRSHDGGRCTFFSNQCDSNTKAVQVTLSPKINKLEYGHIMECHPVIKGLPNNVDVFDKWKKSDMKNCLQNNFTYVSF